MTEARTAGYCAGLSPRVYSLQNQKKKKITLASPRLRLAASCSSEIQYCTLKSRFPTVYPTKPKPAFSVGLLGWGEGNQDLSGGWNLRDRGGGGDAMAESEAARTRLTSAGPLGRPRTRFCVSGARGRRRTGRGIAERSSSASGCGRPLPAAPEGTPAARPPVRRLLPARPLRSPHFIIYRQVPIT